MTSPPDKETNKRTKVSQARVYLLSGSLSTENLDYFEFIILF
jgi:hypothetical protein